MESTNKQHKSASDFFEIDAIDLVQANGRRPHHLDNRIRDKKRPSPNSTAEKKVEAKRTALMNARRQKLTQKLDRVRQVVTRHRQTSASSLSTKQQQIAESLKTAEKNRKGFLKNQADQCAANVKRAKEIAMAQQKRSDEHVQKKRIDLESRLWTSEFRRNLLQKLPRSKLLDESALEMELMHASFSAKRLQRYA
jgi:hypothetical protein